VHWGKTPSITQLVKLLKPIQVRFGKTPNKTIGYISEIDLRAMVQNSQLLFFKQDK